MFSINEAVYASFMLALLGAPVLSFYLYRDSRRPNRSRFSLVLAGLMIVLWIPLVWILPLITQELLMQLK